MAECPGPIVWYEIAPEAGGGAVLHCAACDQVTVTGNPMDVRHRTTRLLREGTAA